eukprot:1267053-Rhodomonas_salina.2
MSDVSQSPLDQLQLFRSARQVSPRPRSRVVANPCRQRFELSETGRTVRPQTGRRSGPRVPICAASRRTSLLGRKDKAPGRHRHGQR